MNKVNPATALQAQTAIAPSVTSPASPTSSASPAPSASPASLASPASPASPSPFDIAQSELDAYMNQQADEIAPEIEIDADIDCFGLIYRVWRGTKRLGNFFWAPKRGVWVAEPFCEDIQELCATPDEAIEAIATSWKA